ncbi:MAG: diaminopimelate epimerase [Lachnospiraceae bacterium]|nr:diaminopimelate epimerase [Lachnospiraceae bacterium]
MHFTKMHGLGNDYLYVYGETPGNAAELSRRLSDRHFGAGSDGMIYISPSRTADFRMRIFNADGSEAKMCGNGIRCVGKYVYDKGYTDKTHLTVETLSGIKTLDMQILAGKVKYVTVDMGRAEILGDAGVPLGNQTVTGTRVSVGNPHFVVFVGDANAARPDAVGPAIEKHPLFPGGVNVEFVEVLNNNRLRMRVWERGSGVTMACGTGACAAAAAAVRKGYCQSLLPVSVTLDGGVLEITVQADGSVKMTGPAETVYEGEFAL